MRESVATGPGRVIVGDAAGLNRKALTEVGAETRSRAGGVVVCGGSRVGVNAEWPPEGGHSGISKGSPAVSYSPTGSPLQYHRRRES